MKLLDYLKAQGAKLVRKVDGPNGAFISYTTSTFSEEDKDDWHTLPIGNRSKEGKLSDFNVLENVPDKDDPTKLIAIATVNLYTTEEEFAIV
mgnify:FL=1|tara:strand:+ start:537 stop:812 length:276 start_codon:yes stop_codon:yes gene_type:complete